MVKKIRLRDTAIKHMSLLLAKKIAATEQAEDFQYQLVAIERGGVPIGEIIGQFLNRPIQTVKISFYNGEEKREIPITDFSSLIEPFTSPVLMIDDLVDTGDTIAYFKEYLEKDNIQASSAVLFYKKTSVVMPDYYVTTTDKWIVFPWEIENEKPQDSE